MNATRPITLLIAALGGEGGGVLTNWIVGAADAAGFPVQSTSIPGVAQRTGATTYYIEIFPIKTAALGGKRPVLALTPGVGDIDIAVASELLEAGRTVANGFVTPQRTFLIASTSRLYAMDEKIAMADGRFDQDRLIKIVNDNAHGSLLVDMAELARQSGSIINAVMLGAIAGSGKLPLSVEQLEAAIRDDGKAVDGNLRGFRAGLEAARAKMPPVRLVENKHNAPVTPELLEHETTYALPALAQPIAVEGIRRLIAYQSLAYAKLYLDRLRPFVELDEAGGARGQLVREIARHLAVRMSYEDVVRVAQAKISPARMARIARDELRVKNEPYSVHDFLKPGIEELCQLLPGFLARPILRLSQRKGWLGRVYFGMEINSTSIGGYLRFLMLAKLRRSAPLRAPLCAGTGADRILARTYCTSRTAVGRPRAGSCRMRPADQGLRRHPRARPRQLRHHRGARNQAGAGRRRPAGACGRRHRQRPHRRAGRSGWGKPRQMPRGTGRADRVPCGGGIARRPPAPLSAFRPSSRTLAKRATKRLAL